MSTCYLWTSEQEILNKGGSLVIQSVLDRMIKLKEETKMKMANGNVCLGHRVEGQAVTKSTMEAAVV